MSRALFLLGVVCLGCHKAPPARPGTRVELRERSFNQFRAKALSLHVTSGVPGETGRALKETAQRLVGEALSRAHVVVEDEAPVVVEVSIDRFGSVGDTSGKCVVLTSRIVRGGQAFLAVEHTARRCVSQDQAWKGAPNDGLGAAVVLAGIALSDPDLVGPYDGALTEILDDLDR